MLLVTGVDLSDGTLTLERGYGSTASGTLRVRSVDCASADSEAVNSTSSDAEVSFIGSP